MGGVRAAGAPPQEAQRIRLRAASWNIHEGVPLVAGADPVAEMTRALSVIDVAALQEVALTPDGEFAQFAALARATGLRHHVTFPMSESVSFPDRRMGVVLLSRWPLTDARRTLLPNPDLSARSGSHILRSHDKGMLAARTAVAGRPCWLGSAHGFPFYLFDRDPSEAPFAAIWSRFADAINQLDDAPLLLGADFNTELRDLLIRRLGRITRRSVVGTPTYRGIESDDIIYTAEFDLRATKVIPTFSDHDLCISEFWLATASGPGRPGWAGQGR